MRLPVRQNRMVVRKPVAGLKPDGGALKSNFSPKDMGISYKLNYSSIGLSMASRYRRFLYNTDSTPKDNLPRNSDLYNAPVA